MTTPPPGEALAPFLTHPEADVTAVRGLPEEVIATLFAQYSRSKAPMRELLAAALAAGDVTAPPAVDQSADALTERARAFHEKWTLGYGHGCYDGATEVLTDEGWVAWPALAGREKLPRFAALNPETHEVEFLDAVRLIVAPYTGPMYRVDAYSVDLAVTPNHKLWVCPTTTRAGRRKEAFELLTAEEVGDKSCAYMIGGAKWSGAQWLGAPPSDFYALSNMSDQDAMLALLGFFVGDGYRDARYHSAVVFNLRRRRKIEYLMDKVARVGLDVREHGHGKFYVRGDGLGDLLGACYTESGDKVLPSWVMHLPASDLRCVHDGLMASDGHRGRDGSMRYDTTSRPLRDQLYELAMKLGWSAYASERPPPTENHAPLYRVHFNTSRLRPEVNKTQGRGETWREPFTGTVYCAELPKFHVLYVRRNGKAVWCGNSVGEHASVHLAVERCSIVAAKIVEDGRLGAAYTEKSTRYVEFGRSSHLSPEECGVPEAHAEAWTQAVEGLLLAYADATEALTGAARKLYPDASDRARGGWVLDRTRTILPGAATTALGATFNARALAHRIRRMGGHPLLEAQNLAAAFTRAGEVIVPTLLRHTDPGTTTSDVQALAQWGSDDDTGGEVLYPFDFAPAVDRASTSPVVRATFYGKLPTPTEAAYGAGARPGAGRYPPRRPHEPAPRAWEYVMAHVEGAMTYGGWRDVQRHRLCAHLPVVVNPLSGTALPPFESLSRLTRVGGADSRVVRPLDERVAASLAAKVAAARDFASKVSAALYAAGYPAEGMAYSLPLGTLIRWGFATNLRSLAHFISLRSGREGHDEYRAVAQDLWRAVQGWNPYVAAEIPCDFRKRDLARK